MRTFIKFMEDQRDDFLKHHYTGHIEPYAYEKYEKEGGLAWLGNPSEYPVLLSSKQYGKYHVEFRQSGEAKRYVKHDSDGEIVRDQNGMAIYMTPDEMKQQNKRATDETIVAFANGKPIGHASNEWGAAGVWVEKPYQGLGIGSDLLVMFMKENPEFMSGENKIGQMTPAGKKMTLSAYDKIAKEKGQDWFKAPAKIEDVTVSIGLDGSMIFNDDEDSLHNWTAFNDKNIKLTIVKNRMSPEVWEQYLDRLKKGFSPDVINPEKYSLKSVNQIPSPEMLEKGREMLNNGVERYEVTKFYNRQ